MLGVKGDERVHDITSEAKDHPHIGIEALLNEVNERGNKIFYSVIYLSPGDYHRFHSPAIFDAHYRRHIVGYLEPVNPVYVKHHRDVFKHNERVNIFGNWFGADKNFFFMSFVGALNVGSIKLDFDESLVTNKSVNPSPYMYDKAFSASHESGPFAPYIKDGLSSLSPSEIKLEKGQLIGRFEMGSTIVLIWESPANSSIHIEEGMKVKLG